MSVLCLAHKNIYVFAKMLHLEQHMLLNHTTRSPFPTPFQTPTEDVVLRFFSRSWKRSWDRSSFFILPRMCFELQSLRYPSNTHPKTRSTCSRRRALSTASIPSCGSRTSGIISQAEPLRSMPLLVGLSDKPVKSTLSMLVLTMDYLIVQPLKK